MRMMLVFIIGLVVGSFLSEYIVAVGQSFSYAVGRVSAE